MEIFDVKENYDIAATMGSDEFILSIFRYTAYIQTIDNNLSIISY